MKRNSEKREIDGKRPRLEETRRCRVIGNDELREGVYFLPVDEILRLSDTGSTFLLVFMRHQGKAAMLGELRQVEITNRIMVGGETHIRNGNGMVSLSQKKSPEIQIPTEFHLPPEEVTSVRRLIIYESAANSQQSIDLIHHIAPLLKEHWFRNFSFDSIPLKKALLLSQGFVSFRGIYLTDEWVHERIIRMPFVMRSKFLEIAVRTLDRRDEALVDWLHFVNPSMAEEKVKAIESFAEAQNKYDDDSLPPLIGKILTFFVNSVDHVSLILQFWTLLKQRFMDDSERRFFTIRFAHDLGEIQPPPFVTSSDRNEELQMLIHRGDVFICRWPIENGIDFTPMLDRSISEGIFGSRTEKYAIIFA